MIFIDTSFVIAWINPVDSFHKTALSLLAEIGDEPWLTTACVLLEVGNSCSRQFRQDGINAIETLLDDDNCTVVSLHPELFAEALQLFRSRADKTWGLIDCVSFVVMRDFETDLALTNDRHFVQAGFRALMLESPEDAR